MVDLTSNHVGPKKFTDWTRAGANYPNSMMFLLSSPSVSFESCAMSAMSHMDVTLQGTDEPWDHIARPYCPLSKGQTARRGEYSDGRPRIPDRMTSALYWAIDRGKEPSNLATVLLCLVPRQQYSQRLVLGGFRACLGPRTLFVVQPH